MTDKELIAFRYRKWLNDDNGSDDIIDFIHSEVSKVQELLIKANSDISNLMLESSKPHSDKQGEEEILKKAIGELSFNQLHELKRLQFYHAMQEYASLERNRAIQEFRDLAIKEMCVAPEKTITNTEVLLIELAEKLKESSKKL